VEDAEHHCRAFVQTWAEAVVRQVKHVRQMRDKAARDGRVYERMGPELGPDELDLARNTRQLWADEQALVWAAHQLERWTRRLSLERGQEPAPRDKVLADLRNALEHLDEPISTAAPRFPGRRAVRSRPCRAAGCHSGPAAGWLSASSRSASSSAVPWRWWTPSRRN
jgi:hypothetical protein